MIPDGDGALTYSTNIEWDIDGWYGDSLDNKPFLTVDENYNVFVSDPILGRVLEFTLDGTFLRTWGTYGSAASEIGVAGGLAVDSDGRIWVADSLNGRLMIFTLPDLATVDTTIEEDINLSNPFGEETQVEETQVDAAPTN